MIIKNIKKTLLIAAVSTFILSADAFAAKIVNYTLFYDGKAHNYSAREISVELDGKILPQSDAPPVIINDRTYAPARQVFEAMGAEVTWNEKTQEVYIIKDNDVVVIKIDSLIGNKNGKDFTLNAAPKIVNDRTLLPIRAISEAFDCAVSWDEENAKVVINDKTDPTPEQPAVTPPSNDGSATVTPPPSNNAGGLITVTDISTPKSVTDYQLFSISADGAISKYTEELISDNRLVIDLHNANMGVNGNSVDTQSPYVKSVRMSQFQNEPEKISRVVLDLNESGLKYNISLSSDKKTLQITFDANVLESVSASFSGNNDIIKVTSKYNKAGSVSSPNANSVVYSLPNATLRATAPTGDFKYITGLKVAQVGSSAQVTINIADNAAIKHSVTDDGVIFTAYKKPSSEVKYDASANRLSIPKDKPLAISEIAHNDDFLNKKYTLTLNGDYSDIYADETVDVDDERINGYSVLSSNGKTDITFNGKTINAVKITEDASRIYFDLLDPKAMYSNIVVIDPGHGAEDNGTSGNGLLEKDVNLAIVQKAVKLLEANGNIKVYATRLNDSRPDNASRAALANDVADLFVSVHMNSANGGAAENPLPNGTETLYKMHSNDALGRLNSQTAANIMQKHMVEALSTNDRGLKLRTDLLVLNATKVPAVLVETCFLSNPGDAAKIAQEEYRDKAAKAICDAIVEMFSLPHR